MECSATVQIQIQRKLPQKEFKDESGVENWYEVLQENSTEDEIDKAEEMELRTKEKPEVQAIEKETEDL